MQKQPDSPLSLHDIDQAVKIHNWVDTVFKARVFLSRLSVKAAADSK